MLTKKYDFKATEVKIQRFWQREGIYQFQENSTKELYSIDTPPPTVNGSLHIGHIFSYTQAEMIARFQRMQGKNVFYPFGFDDNGLPTERLVEKQANIKASTIPRRDFIEKCIETTKKYEEEFKELWQSLGFSVDWRLQYETISPSTQRISQRSFLALAKKGKAYLKESPVLWCTNCQTSIAQAELDTVEKDTSFNWLPFRVKDETLLIATTRPELLYGCVALFVNPEDKRYQGFIGKQAQGPLYDFFIPILADTKVDMNKGSGIVMCCTFGDAMDLEWYTTHNLPYKRVINPDGNISSEVPIIGGLSIKEARKRILQILDENNLLIKSQELLHQVGVHERCNSEIEIIPSKQWYIDILTEQGRYLAAADEINWYPATMKKRYQLWVENLKWDWCISRQRYFGVPFPVWYCNNCGEGIFAREEDLPVNPLEAPPKEGCGCGSNSFTPESAVLDTWATSALTPLINGKWGEHEEFTDKLLPMSMRTQAHEIIRTWAFYTIVMSLYHTGKIPWRDIMVCGFVQAKKGEKISKSKSNSTLTPSGLIERYSADAVRYWAASTKLGTDTFFSEEELQASTRLITKLWNAAKFTLMHLEDYENHEVKGLLPIDRWIINGAMETQLRASQLLEKYEIGAARQLIDEFFWRDYCDNYLELVKDRLYKPEIHGRENRLSGQFALYHSFLAILKLYALYIPHITEEIYQEYYRSHQGNISIHCLQWEKVAAKDIEIRQMGNFVCDILAEARKYKSERKLSLKTPLEVIDITVPANLLQLLLATKDDIAVTTGGEKINIIPSEDFSIKIF